MILTVKVLIPPAIWKFVSQGQTESTELRHAHRLAYQNSNVDYSYHLHIAEKKIILKQKLCKSFLFMACMQLLQQFQSGKSYKASAQFFSPRNSGEFPNSPK